MTNLDSAPDAHLIASTSDQTPIAGKYYYIVDTRTDAYLYVATRSLAISGTRLAVGKPVVQTAPDTFGQWRFILAQDYGWVWIENRERFRVDGVYAQYATNADVLYAQWQVGTYVVIARPQRSQVWTLEDAGSGNYYLRSMLQAWMSNPNQQPALYMKTDDSPTDDPHDGQVYWIRTATREHASIWKLVAV